MKTLRYSHLRIIFLKATEQSRSGVRHGGKQKKSLIGKGAVPLEEKSMLVSPLTQMLSNFDIQNVLLPQFCTGAMRLMWVKRS